MQLSRTTIAKEPLLVSGDPAFHPGMESSAAKGCQRSRWKWGIRTRQHGPDSIHSWLVAGACALTSCFAMAGRRSSGILFVAMQETFRTNKSDGSWPIMVMGAVIYLAGLITGPVAHRFTARPVIIAGAATAGIGASVSYFATSIGFMTFTLGVVHAIGSGMVFIVAPTVINEHFVKHKGLATGLTYTGVTMSTLFFPKLLEYLTGAYGLRGSLLIFGAVLMNGLAFALFPRTPSWRNNSTETEKIAENTPVSSNEGNRRTLHYGFTIFKEPIFYVIMYSFNAFSLVFDCYVALFVDFAIDRGLPVSTAVTMSSAEAVAEIAGRLMVPVAVDHRLIGNKAVMLLLLGAEGVLLILVPVMPTPWLIFAAALGIAFLVGIGMVLFPMIIASYFGRERLSMSFGMVIASAGLLSFMKPSLLGYFRDKHGAYDWLFIICGSLSLVGTAMWVLVLSLEARHKKMKIQTADLPNNTIITAECRSSIKHQAGTQ
uniref:Major facilitator superfamily (MFS) profile domain-containing protein n=1 Tax=Amblyomma maculatum TaxID=34609 RepID=G3MSI8_AMBMU